MKKDIYVYKWVTAAQQKWTQQSKSITIKFKKELLQNSN